MNYLHVVVAATFLALTAGILLLRTSTGGWYHVAAGCMACAAAVYWNFSLTDKEVIAVILDAVVWLEQHTWGPLLGVNWSSSLRSWAQSLAATEPLFITTLLLGSYIIVSRLAMLLVRLLAQAVARRFFRSNAGAAGDRSNGEAAAGGSAGKRQGGSATAERKPTTMRLGDAIAAINESLAASAASKVLSFGLLAALTFLCVSAVFGHQLGSAPPLAKLDWTNPFGLHRDVFWLGLYILVAELLGQLWKLERAQRAAADAPARAGQQPRRTLAPLDWLFFEGVRTHGAHILFSEPGAKRATAPPASAPAPAPAAGEMRQRPSLRKIKRLLRDNSSLSEDRIADVVGEFEDFILHPRYMVLHDPLHPLHFDIIFALCEQQQSQGRMSLVVCPERLVAYVSKSLEACASGSLASLIQRGAVLGRRRGESVAIQWRRDLSYSYVVVADTDLERELLGPGPGGQSLLENLGMIVAIEAEGLQMSLLRLQLPRVWLRVPRNRIKVLVQVGSLSNHASLIEALLPLVGDERPITPTLDFAASSSTHKIVWANGPTTTDSIFRAYLSRQPRQDFSTALGLVTYALYGAERARRIEMDDLNINLSEAEEAEKHLSQIRVARTQQSVGGAFKDATQPKDTTARVVIIDEDASIPIALAGFYDENRNGEVLVNVVAHAYPLRDYQADQLSRPGSRGIFTRYPQLAADPRGGLREMLSTLYDALRERRGDGPDDRGLRRSQIIKQFLHLLPPKLLSQINLIPGRDGFERLFQEIDVGVRIDVRREESETRYEIEGVRGEFPELHFNIPILVDNQDRGFRIPVGDIGLSILPEQSILLDGHEHVIRRISKSRIDSQRNQNQIAEVTVPVLDYVWRSRTSGTNAETSRSDGTASSPETTLNWFLDSKTSWPGASAAHYYASFTRHTVGKIVCSQDMQPLSGDRLHPPVSPLHGADQHERRRDYQSVWHLRLNRIPLLQKKGPAELAFTMCVTLQDVVRALFPRWRHRINVVSPMAADIFAKLRPVALTDPTSFKEGADRVDALLACAYPRLRIDQPVAGSTPPAAGAAQVRPTGLDIFLIEDTDFDLGVVRRLQDEPGALFEEVIEYLSWLKGNHFSSRYHRFGAAVDGGALIFEQALMIMKAVHT